MPADVFSFGVVTWEILTQERPFLRVKRAADLTAPPGTINVCLGRVGGGGSFRVPGSECASVRGYEMGGLIHRSIVVRLKMMG